VGRGKQFIYINTISKDMVKVLKEDWHNKKELVSDTYTVSGRGGVGEIWQKNRFKKDGGGIEHLAVCGQYLKQIKYRGFSTSLYEYYILTEKGERYIKKELIKKMI